MISHVVDFFFGVAADDVLVDELFPFAELLFCACFSAGTLVK